MNYQIYRAWADASKGIRQCQKADKALAEGNADSAASHYSKALDKFAIAADHLGKAEADAEVKAGKLLDDGNKELQKAIDEWADGNLDKADKHYDKALDKYDEALDLVD
ncbi:hypothetical protein [Marinobacter sp. F4206]|uniref:hypothetical protein n=1 Tax=Marinobacter sp. F4206 TaxID=2861777 RepID=UPI001C5D5A07|nr:hypothetical protein [Marinobacter sp. F4206]MBW4936032.1 hypothetical protein [Marinobacter sp. F4206]